MEELRGQNGTQWYKNHQKYIYKRFFKYKWVFYIVRQSVLNPYRMCLDVVDLASVAWRREFVNPTGGNFWKSTHKNLVETYNFFEIWVRDIIIKSSRDTHHHSTSHILYDHKKASRDSLIKSSRDLSAYAHIHSI